MFPVRNFQSRDLKSKQDKILSSVVHLLENGTMASLGPASRMPLTLVNPALYFRNVQIVPLFM